MEDNLKKMRMEDDLKTKMKMEDDPIVLKG
jgi:hypothetical protein